MTRAKTAIALAEQLASKISSLPASAGASEARRALQESSELLGLSTPIVSREVAGGLEVYWGELARQVAEFLTAPGVDGSLLKREGGIIPLVDLFALYNRARGVGTNPVSPNGPAQTVRTCACSVSIVFFVGGEVEMGADHRSTRESHGFSKGMWNVHQTTSTNSTENFSLGINRDHGLECNGRSP